MLQELSFDPIYRAGDLILGTGNVAIVTGWTPKERALKHFSDESSYAVIGNLYSAARGIDFLIRNVLSNPQVNIIVILSGTREDESSGSCQALLDFFVEGYYEGLNDLGQPCWVIKSTIPAYIDREISSKALNELRDLSLFRYFKIQHISDLKNIKTFELLAPKLPRNKYIFPKKDFFRPTIMPGRKYGHVLDGENVADVWLKVINLIKNTGVIRPTMGGHQQWQELIDITTVIHNEPADFHIPTPNYLPFESDFIKEYADQVFLKPEEDNPDSAYTYGSRLRNWFKCGDQVEHVIDHLNSWPDSARAVMNLWDVEYDTNSPTPPCLNHIWFRIFENKLSMTCTFRSQDMFSAYPANAMGLRALQQHVFDKLDVNDLAIGPLIIISQSAHIYDDCWEAVDNLIENYYSPTETLDDPVGNFNIYKEDKTLIVEQIDPKVGLLIQTYKGIHPDLIFRQILQKNVGIQASHAFYLGKQLQRVYEN